MNSPSNSPPSNISNDNKNYENGTPQEKEKPENEQQRENQGKQSDDVIFEKPRPRSKTSPSNDGVVDQVNNRKQANTSNPTENNIPTTASIVPETDSNILSLEGEVQPSLKKPKKRKREEETADTPFLNKYKKGKVNNALNAFKRNLDNIWESCWDVVFSWVGSVCLLSIVNLVYNTVI